ERKPAELDKGAQQIDVAVVAVSRARASAGRRNARGGKTDRRRIIAAVLPAAGEIGAQGAPGGLLAHVESHSATGAGDEIIFRAKLKRIGAVEEGRKRPPGMDIPLRPQEAADLHTDVCARNVVERGAVEGADFHVFYWLGLDRKIRCLPSRDRNQSGRGAEEEAFHHLHLEPPIVVPCGRVPSMAGWNCTP